MKSTNLHQLLPKTLFRVTIFLLFIRSEAIAQSAQPNPAVLQERLNSLERENQRLRKDVADLEREAEKLKAKDDELEDGIDKYEPFKYWSYVLTILGISSVGGLLGLYFKVIPGKVNHQVDTVITKLLTDRREDFLGLLKEYDFEKSVKQKHQIVLLSHRKGSDDYHVRMLEKNGFNVKPFTKLEQLQAAEFSPEDIVIINNDGGHWGKEDIQLFINGLPNYCFYFGGGQITINGDRLDRFTAANFRTQFIGNLMNVLKYAHHPN